MSYIFNIKKNISDDISFFESDRYIIPALTFRGVRKTKIEGDVFITGIAVGVKLWHWSLYFSILWERRKKSTDIKYQDIKIESEASKISIAKVEGVSIQDVLNGAKL